MKLKAEDPRRVFACGGATEEWSGVRYAGDEEQQPAALTLQDPDIVQCCNTGRKVASLPSLAPTGWSDYIPYCLIRVTRGLRGQDL